MFFSKITTKIHFFIKDCRGFASGEYGLILLGFVVGIIAALLILDQDMETFFNALGNKIDSSLI